MDDVNGSAITVNMDSMGGQGGQDSQGERETLLSQEPGVTENQGTELPQSGKAGQPLPMRAQAQGGGQGEGAPGEYEAFALPQGIDPEDAEVSEALDEAQGLFREMGLNQQQAQRLIDLHMKHFIGALAEDQDRFERELNRRVAAWGMDVKRDPDFGGSRLNESLTSIKRAIAHLGGEPLMYALNQETGLINHPEVFKAFARMGRYFSEDKLVMGANGKGIDDSPSGMAARVYPNMNARRS